MRRTDSPWLPFDAGSDLLRGLSNPWGQSAQSEQPSAANLLGDFADGCSPHWESAWIDLGGEG
jgi:hypothetical protein